MTGLDEIGFWSRVFSLLIKHETGEETTIFSYLRDCISSLIQQLKEERIASA